MGAGDKHSLGGAWSPAPPPPSRSDGTGHTAQPVLPHWLKSKEVNISVTWQITVYKKPLDIYTMWRTGLTSSMKLNCVMQRSLSVATHAGNWKKMYCWRWIAKKKGDQYSTFHPGLEIYSVM